MKKQSKTTLIMVGIVLFLPACSPNEQSNPGNVFWEPREIIDLGTLVTEDLPQRVSGAAFLAANGFERQNSFEVISWKFQMAGESVSGSNAYYTFFNHGGPHVDAPNHISVGGGIDSYPIEAFTGPSRVFDVRRFPVGRSIPAEIFEDSVQPGDVVLIFTGYTPPQTEEALPETITLTYAAAEYLAGIPIRAFGTDAFSVGNWQDRSPVDAESATARALPIHYSLLSRGIPVYEQLFNVDRLLDKENMYFVGVPLNIKEGDGMLVRPVVFVY